MLVIIKEHESAQAESTKEDDADTNFYKRNAGNEFDIHDLSYLHLQCENSPLEG